MTVRPPAFQSEPQIQFLYQLVREIADGHVQLPRFQRPFLWTEEQQLELFRSIRMGMPIGSIMMWRTNLTDVRSYEKLGPYVLKPSSEPIRSYVIDGHQRLATLFGALHVLTKDEELPERIAYFDLESDDFLFASREEPAKPMWLPLRYVLDFPSLLPFQRSFGGQADEKDLIRRIDTIVTAFSTYKIPVLPIATNDLDHITKTFQRINSQGTVMGEVHMVAALTWSKTFDLNERIAAWKEEHLTPLGFGNLDDDVVLHACKAALGFDAYDRDVDSVSRALRDNPGALEESLTSLVEAVRFLRDACRVLSTKILPYSSHLVVIAEVIRRVRQSGNTIDFESLRPWYWALAYSGTRAPLPRLVEMVIPNGAKATQISPMRPRPLPKRFDFRSARCKLIALRLANTTRTGHALLAREGANAMVRLFNSRSMFDKFDDPSLYDSPANWILVEPTDASAVRTRLIEALDEGEIGPLVEYSFSEMDAKAYHLGTDIFIASRTRTLEVMELEFFKYAIGDVWLEF